MYQLIHNLYFDADLLKQGERYRLTVTSLRKFFKTHMNVSIKGRWDIPSNDLVEYMMGHTVSTYNQIKNLGIEFLRGIYAAAGLRIRPESKDSRLAQLKVFARRGIVRRTPSGFRVGGARRPTN